MGSALGHLAPGEPPSPAAPLGSDKAWDGEILTDAVAPGDELQIGIVRASGQRDVVTSTHWMPRGVGLPVAGSRCLIEYDDDGEVWITCWDGPGLLIPEPWHTVGAAGEPAYENGWITAASFPTNPASFYKDPFGVVRLKGFVGGGTFGGNPAFTLPVGSRPGQDSRFAVSSGDAFGECLIDASGEVWPFVGASWMCLSSVSFRAV